MNEIHGKTYREYRSSPRFKILIYKTIACYKKHGLWQTMWRIWVKLKAMLMVKKELKVYPVEAYSAAIQGASRLKKVSFMVGMVEGESKRYRVYNIVEGLQSRGINSCVFYETNVDELDPVMDSDLVVVFRARMSRQVDAIIKKLDAAGTPVVFDIDDLIFGPDYVDCLDEARGLPNVLKNEYANDFIKYRQVLERCRLATCTTEFLASVIRQVGKKCFVVPNTINRTQYELAKAVRRHPESKERGKTKISYLSGTYTHDRDFLEASGALIEILRTYRNTELHVIGPLQLPGSLNKTDGRVFKKPLMPHLEMLRCLSGMDINIAPLEQNNPFTDGKSEIKIFEAALVEVPTVASRVVSYSRCISDRQNGFLAGSREEWLHKLCYLIENERFRKEMGLTARKDFVGRFYIENAIGDIIKIYEKIADNH